MALDARLGILLAKEREEEGGVEEVEGQDREENHGAVHNEEERLILHQGAGPTGLHLGDAAHNSVSIISSTLVEMEITYR